MEYEDRVTIETPEGVTLELILAGVGSRAAAAAIDALLQIVIVFALLTILFAMVGEPSVGPDEAPLEVDDQAPWLLIGLAIANVVIFVILFFYYILFETLWSGRTPGKRAAGLRVVRLRGEPIDFRASAVRNLLRLVDLLPPITYAVGVVSILMTERNQRLGDLLAGTMVVRDRSAGRKARGEQPGAGTVAPEKAEDVLGWDVSGVRPDEIATVRSFLQRRHELEPKARTRLAGELASRLQHKVAGAPPASSPEEFLEKLALAKALRD